MWWVEKQKDKKGSLEINWRKQNRSSWGTKKIKLVGRKVDQRKADQRTSNGIIPGTN